MATAKHPLDVDGRVVDITNPAKVLYPQAGFTKADVIDYYIRIAPALLPHMRDRPVSMKRYPDGVEAGYFFQKEAPPNKPPWMPTFPVPSDRKGHINYLLCNDRPSLVWLANAADLELHTFMHRVPKVSQPTMMVFDLDPGAPADAIDCCRVALWLRDDLRALGLQAWPKLSGGKGVQVHVPFNVAGVTYELTGGVAKAMAQVLERDHPKQVTSNMRKDLRGGKVFIDWSQNSESKTTVCVYSLRAQPKPTVAVPLTWKEVEAGADAKDLGALRFGPEDAIRRYGELGDLMAPVLTLKQRLSMADLAGRDVPEAGASTPEKAKAPTKRPARSPRKRAAKRAVAR